MKKYKMLLNTDGYYLEFEVFTFKDLYNIKKLNWNKVNFKEHKVKNNIDYQK